MSLWFDGIELSATEEPPVAVLPDYPSAMEDRQRASVELGRLTSLGGIRWYPEGAYPPGLCVRPSHLTAEEDKVRAAQDWSDALYPLNSCLSNPPAQYGAMDDLLQLLTPGAFVGGIDLQDCFLRRLVAPSRRRYLGVRRPGAGVLGVYLFLPHGLGPAPGWNDVCVKAVRANFPRLRAVDFADDMRCADVNGEHDALAAGMTGLMSLLDRIGPRYHA